MDALVREIRQRGKKDCRVETVYLGGGTPSLLGPRLVEKILGAVFTCFDLPENPEVTVEVNPGTVDRGYFDDLLSIGVNRVNIGVQSFDDEKLGFLGRIHSAREGKRAVESALDAGIGNTGMDMIYCIPSEDAGLWAGDLATACSYSPAHLSCYTLTFEKDTCLYRMMKQGRTRPMDKESAADLFMDTVRILTKAGYLHYEISNFAKDAASRSRHNMTYWRNSPYLGFGAGAHSFDGAARYWNRKNVHRYIRELEAGKKPDFVSEALTTEQKLLEAVMLGLRTMEGIDVNLMERLLCMDFSTFFSPLPQRLEQNAMAVSGRDGFRLTPKGMCRLDSIVSGFADRILAATFSS